MNNEPKYLTYNKLRAILRENNYVIVERFGQQFGFNASVVNLKSQKKRFRRFSRFKNSYVTKVTPCSFNEYINFKIPFIYHT